MNQETYEEWLNEEQAFLNKNLIKIGQNESPNQRLDASLKSAQNELNKLSNENKKLLTNLEKKIDQEFLNFSGNPPARNGPKLEQKIQSKMREMSSDINAERIYLRQTLFSLEQRQIADSIKRIGRRIADDRGGTQKYELDFYFEVWFEDAIVKEPVFLEEEYVESLNNLRKYSLFCIHKTGNKTRIPFYSQTVG